ncbi:hypothetical protein SY83_01745 [Paenibacillus swuensis]|uniref:DZANK-type domain-containing protein n=1 Tax=Paenibacillus swuensis TaxID=1178515 RepID=A0A172TE86_9BACL|nr:zinc ribbon domain-containing protein [Paenibacillus swuensis]ANE45262.1 hypothetical protein SY83_01745 [Paenibacillus swuensis]
MSFLNKMKQGATDAARMAQQTLEVTKLKSQISSKEREIERNHTAIGQAVFAAFQAGDLSSSESAVNEYCSVIVKLQSEIQVVEQQILQVKNERVCTCGHVIPGDATFCSKCGKKYEPVAVSSDAEFTEAVPASQDKVAVLCASCGKENEPGSLFCIGCGAVLTG